MCSSVRLKGERLRINKMKKNGEKQSESRNERKRKEEKKTKELRRNKEIDIDECNRTKIDSGNLPIYILRIPHKHNFSLNRYWWVDNALHRFPSESVDSSTVFPSIELKHQYRWSSTKTFKVLALAKRWKKYTKLIESSNGSGSTLFIRVWSAQLVRRHLFGQSIRSDFKLSYFSKNFQSSLLRSGIVSIEKRLEIKWFREAVIWWSVWDNSIGRRHRIISEDHNFWFFR